MRPAAALCVALCTLFAGCGGLLGAPPPPNTTTTPTTTTPATTATTPTASASKLARAQATHEYPTSRAPVQRARQASNSAITAVRRFATAYINWNAGTLTSDMRALAGRSIGQARAAVELAGANSAQDYELRRDGIANQGSVEAIARLPGASGRYVVVTLEQTTASNTIAYQGLRAEWHVAVATVVELGQAGWVLSGWQPEN